MKDLSIFVAIKLFSACPIMRSVFFKGFELIDEFLKAVDEPGGSILDLLPHHISTKPNEGVLNVCVCGRGHLLGKMCTHVHCFSVVSVLASLYINHAQWVVELTAGGEASMSVAPSPIITTLEKWCNSVVSHVSVNVLLWTNELLGGGGSLVFGGAWYAHQQGDGRWVLANRWKQRSLFQDQT